MERADKVFLISQLWLGTYAFPVMLTQDVHLLAGPLGGVWVRIVPSSYHLHPATCS